MTIITTILAYSCILLLISRITEHKIGNDIFFRANRQSPWYLVAFGMIGASISGVTLVSVPGMVMLSDMTYMQTCLSFVLGYFAVAYLLLPVYYHLKLTIIYSYLQTRLDNYSYKTGTSFFLLSKMTGAVVRFYVVYMVLQRFVLDVYGMPFSITVVSLVAFIWLYTRRGRVRTLVLTNTFQTLCTLLALILIIYKVVETLGMSLPEAAQAIANDSYSHIFVFDGWVSKQSFWKQFLSGTFIVIVMTGLDQDMMQKNLTCKVLREAQENMCTYGFVFVPINLLFLFLDVLLVMYFNSIGQALSDMPGNLMLQAVAGGQLGTLVIILFTIGIVAACFSSAGSALTALTAAYYVDICGRLKDEKLRKQAHIGVSIMFILFILIFRYVSSASLIDTIYAIVSYTYGPLLGLFAFGLCTKRTVNDRLTPYIAVASPLLCFTLDTIVSRTTDCNFGYELLMLNGLITFLACFFLPARKQGSDCETR